MFFASSLAGHSDCSISHALSISSANNATVEELNREELKKTAKVDSYKLSSNPRSLTPTSTAKGMFSQ